MTKRAIYSKISACKSSCWSTLTWILGQLSTANQQHMHALTISYQFKTERDSYSEIGASRSSWLLPRLWIIWLMTEWGINFPSGTKLSSKWVWTHSLPTNRWSSGLWKYSVIFIVGVSSFFLSLFQQMHLQIRCLGLPCPTIHKSQIGNTPP